MAGESQQVPKKEPDPTVMTTEQLDRALRGEHDRVDARFDAVAERFRSLDEATKVLHEVVTRTPTPTQIALQHVEELIDERFRSANSAHDHIQTLVNEQLRSVSQQFKERDTRSERESRDNKVAVDAAFAAQKEAAAKQDEANQKSIDKSERATNESIAKLGDVVQASVKALADKIDDNKARIATQDSILVGLIQKTAGGNESRTAIYAAVSVVVAIIIGAITVFTFIATHK